MASGESQEMSEEEQAMEAHEQVADANGTRHFVVGIGASAGGLEALSALIAQLPGNLGASYVIVQHMSPNHRSMLVQLIARETPMAVSEVVEGESPQPDHIYITPPNRNIALQEGAFVLTEPAAEVIPKPSVDVFFTSLAEDCGENAIGVVLSGTGSDGAVGVRAIKASGGLVFAQEPGSAKYSGMPQSAIDTDCVNWVMTPGQIAAEIEVIVRAQGAIPPPVSGGPVPATLRSLLQRVMRHARVDFSGYKESTVWRRILRRMVSNRVHTMEDYLQLTEKNPEELNQLCKEILISVTSFFRDPLAFNALREPLGELLAGKSPGDEIRIWVAGCATGEEAYSIAILLSELTGSELSSFRVQIFATDIDLNAMAVARRGVYPDSALAEIPRELIERYFIKRESNWELAKSVRDLVVFARQDLAQDPPFLRLDLITCRNVLIYFQTSLQEQVLSTFHYALRPGGLLFLGKSETAHQRDGLFESITREAKLFRRRGGDSRLPAQMLSATPPPAADPRLPVAKSRSQMQDEQLLGAVIEASLPPSVVVTSQLDIRHVFGDVSAFLNLRPGRPDFNLLSLVRAEWKIELQTLLYQVAQRKTRTLGRLRAVGTGPGGRGVRVSVVPLGFRLAGGEEAYLVGFELPASDEENVDPSAQPMVAEARNVEEELIATREHLQTVIEELETSNEETQALNEELQASNEELQASNEELQASNEELQSTNEELTTVNEELQIKTAELADTNADLENIQNSIGFLILVVNDQMRLVRYNLAAAQWLSLGQGAIGDSLRAVSSLSHFPALVPTVEEVLRERRPLERQLAHDGRYYQLRVMPRIMSSRETSGAVITLSEESELVEAQRRLRESEQRLRAVMSHSLTAVAVKDLSGRYEYVNPKFGEVFGISPDDVLGRTDQQVFGGELGTLLRERDLDAIRHDGLMITDETLPLAAGKRFFRALRFPLKGEDGVVYAVCLKLSSAGPADTD